jgi:hypothetical protein
MKYIFILLNIITFTCFSQVEKIHKKYYRINNIIEANDSLLIVISSNKDISICNKSLTKFASYDSNLNIISSCYVNSFLFTGNAKGEIRKYSINGYKIELEDLKRPFKSNEIRLISPINNRYLLVSIFNQESTVIDLNLKKITYDASNPSTIRAFNVKNYIDIKLKNQTVNSFIRLNDTFLLATNDGIHIIFPNDKPQLIGTNMLIESFTINKERCIWYAGYLEGEFVINSYKLNDITGYNIPIFLRTKLNEASINTYTIYDMLIDKYNNLWIAMDVLVRINLDKPKEYEIFDYNNGLDCRKTGELYYINEEDILLIGTKGCGLFKLKVEKTPKPEPKPHKLHFFVRCIRIFEKPKFQAEFCTFRKHL